MKMHPAEIAAEVKHFNFFRNLAEDVVLQLSTMMEPVTIPAGHYLVKEGETNNRLFFLRKGRVDLTLAEETLASYFTPGEVLGEMSVISGKSSTINLKAIENCECFVIDTNNFNLILPKNRDPFFSYIYRLYASILCERLEKSAEKARFFEVAHKELHQVQQNLAQSVGKSALLIQTDKKQLVMTKMAVGGTGIHMDIAHNAEEATSKAVAHKYDVIIFDEKTLDIVKPLRAKNPNTQFALLLSKDIQENVNLLPSFLDVDFVITKDPDDRQMTVKAVLTALSKILSHDLFGIEKYLSWGVDIQTQMIKNSEERLGLKEGMLAYLKNTGIRSTILDRSYTVLEELLMNAIYDAPTDPHGKPLYNHMSRKQIIVLETELQSILRYGTDGNMLAVSVTDPFGGLSKEIIINYLKSCYDGKAGSLNAGKGGAGRGIHQIIENADLTIFNVKARKKTEVICLFSLEPTRRSAYPSFHYFFES